jgi:chromosomal replication initiation ATPase DnaA
VIENIKAYIFQKYGTPWDVIQTHNRSAGTFFIRQEAMWIAKTHSGMTSYKLQKHFNRNRNAITSSYHRYEGYIADGLIGKPDFRCGISYKQVD